MNGIESSISMDSLPHGTHLSKEFVQEGDCPSLTSYGQIALKRNLGWYLRQKTNEDENQALVSQVKKRKEREEGNLKKPKKPRHKKDVSKVQCFNCRKMGHYAVQCLHKHEKEKEKKKHHAHAT